MKNIELLSPAGNKNSFYASVKSGADAVYFGLSKFNARQKAENISIEDLNEIVKYAHLKQVKVYITLNTLLTNQEIKEAVEMVGICLKANVDAFIVQDVGLIYVLKRIYPNIVLHGSTQLGVHNVRGARIAKEMGLSRIVLSREVSLQDIIEIKNNVDIELEVFVQGAMCVSFSGNCYLSSLKCGASGNRGLCKQLCRLPYKLKSNNNYINGYVISPCDNCMLGYLEKLINIGVTSFKIEGRLRHVGYVSVATNTYRRAINNILNHKQNNITKLQSDLAKVFSRGDYKSGYFDGKDIINVNVNNHMGELIGKVIDVSKFKDIYKIKIDINKTITKGDGLKFENNGEIISIGVGNVDVCGKFTMVYGNKYVKIGSNVYLTRDTNFENSMEDLSKKRDISIFAKLVAGQPIEVIYSSDKESVKINAGICERAIKNTITEETIINQLSKINSDVYNIKDIKIITKDAFVSIANLNEFRRKAIDDLEKKFLIKNEFEKNDYPEILQSKISFSNLAIIDDTSDIERLCDKYDALIFAPENYSIDAIYKKKTEYSKYFDTPFIINLPNIAMYQELNIIDKIVERFKNDNVIFVANNLYAFDYIKTGANIMIGSQMNIANDYSATFCVSYGIGDIIASIESFRSLNTNFYRLTGKCVLMTFAHCPIKTLYKCECKDCKYTGKLELVGSDKYSLRRYKVANCYFELIDNVYSKSKSKYIVEDIRN